jgi:hypothetical protein
VAAGQWRADADGSPRCYVASDNLVSPAWRGIPVAEVLAATRADGLHFDAARGSGVVFHMLSGLAVDGRCGLTAIAHAPDEADRLVEETRRVMDGVADGAEPSGRAEVVT